jgi:signal transduction histidine kinase
MRENLEAPRRRILVIDDNREIHKDFEKIFQPDLVGAGALAQSEAALFGESSEQVRQPKFDVDFASQGTEGAALIARAQSQHEPYALAFVDMRMPPGWDGIETTARIWEIDPAVQIVICTAYSDHSWEEVRHKLGHSDRLVILKKPFDNIEVLQLASALTEKWLLAQREFVSSVRKAGMAEIANSVLHNVGNVLNSIRVSAALIQTRVRGLKTDGLSLATGLMSEHAAGIGDFLTNDAKGQRLPGYLSKLTEVFVADKRAVLEELASLTRSIDHVEDIVSTQQSYAGTVSVSGPVRIDELVEDALRMTTVTARIGVVKELQPMPPVLLDKHLLLQILINLISNAKQAMQGVSERPHEMRICCAAGGTAEEPRLRIRVADNGVGIAPENLARLFVHGFTTRARGHGFGLHSSALAAKTMGGTLTAHSDGVGRGAVFTLDLPLTAVVENHEYA